MSSGIRVLLVLLGVLALALAQGCAKRCDSPEGCQRSCNCTDIEDNITYACAMTFQCNLAEESCDPMHGESCDKICETYAAAGSCGRQCTNDEQCLLRCTCEIEGGGSLVCEQPFACDKDVGVCEPSHALTPCESLCQTCYVGP